MPTYLKTLMGLAAAAGVGAALPAAEPAEATLERLRYDRPGLTVDLGVGLWAWPMVIDWDDDGDPDLLVACPDKPSNGVYFFENPAGKGVAFPTFKPGKRLGPARQNMRLSYADGVPRLTAEHLEFPDFRRGDFTTTRPLAPKRLVAAAKHVRQNTWQFADFGGEGADLLVGHDIWDDFGWFDTNDWWKGYDAAGNWTRGPLRGHVYRLRRTGPAAEPKYALPEQLQAGGKPLETAGWPSPCAADFDGDGDADLLCGEFLDGFTYYRNDGTQAEPRFAAGKPLAHDGRPLRMDLEMIVPTAFDWDADGDVDLLVGDEDGRVAFLEHTGRIADGVPQFLPPRYFRQEADELKCGALAAPCGFDWDGDGDDDLVCGNTAGYIEWFENLSGPKVARPRWAAPRRLTANGQTIRVEAGPDGSIQGPVEAKWGYTTLSVADWDHDGLPDVVANSILGQVVWFRNVGTRTMPQLAAAEPVTVAWNGPAPAPVWTRRPPKGNELVTQWRTTPAAVDFTGDGLTDLVMLDHEGYLALFARRRDAAGKLELSPPARVLCDEAGKPLRLNAGEGGRSGRRKLCLVDWDGDGRLDVLLNSRNAALLRQLPPQDGKYRFAAAGDVSTRNIEGHDTSPTTVDFDGDGVRDLLIGAEDGRLYFARNPHAKP